MFAEVLCVTDGLSLIRVGSCWLCHASRGCIAWALPL